MCLWPRCCEFSKSQWWWKLWTGSVRQQPAQKMPGYRKTTAKVWPIILGLDQTEIDFVNQGYSVCMNWNGARRSMHLDSHSSDGCWKIRENIIPTTLTSTYNSFYDWSVYESIFPPYGVLFPSLDFLTIWRIWSARRSSTRTPEHGWLVISHCVDRTRNQSFRSFRA
jgi:hypothetical protein